MPTFQCLARPLATALVILASTFSAPAVACLCSCSIFPSPNTDAAVTDVPADYRHIFSGLVLSTERINEPVVAAPTPSGELMMDPGHWIKSKVLVLRTWRGTPPAVAEVWTPVHGDCDSPPFTGLYFVALVREEKGRDVAGNSPCECALRAAATEGSGSFAVAGVAILASTVCTVGFAFFLLLRVIRPRGSDPSAR